MNSALQVRHVATRDRPDVSRSLLAPDSARAVHENVLGKSESRKERIGDQRGCISGQVKEGGERVAFVSGFMALSIKF
jgi:hypothetical protein